MDQPIYRLQNPCLYTSAGFYTGICRLRHKSNSPEIPQDTHFGSDRVISSDRDIYDHQSIPVGALIYSLRYYMSFADSATVNVYAIIMAISLILASFSVEPKKPGTHFLNSKKTGFIILSICLAISVTSYDDNIRLINAIILLIDLVILSINHLNISINKK